MELPQGLDVDFANDAVVGDATLDPKYVAFPTVLEWCADAAVAVLPIIALDNVGVHVQCSGFHQRIEGFSIRIPFRYKQRIYPAAQGRSVTDIGQFAADQQGKSQITMLDDR